MVEGIGVPFDLCGPRMGSRLGPAALRLAGLEDVFEELDVKFAWGGDLKGCSDELGEAGKILDVGPLITCIEELRQRTEASLQAGRLPLILGGDHAIAMGSTAAALNHFDEPVFVLWIDAHADVNTPGTSPSGNIHGMPLAALMGQPSGVEGAEDARWRQILEVLGPARLKPEHVAWFGLRDVDSGERRMIRGCPGCHATTMQNVDRNGLINELSRFDAWMRSGAATRLWISFDVDSLDPILAPGTGTSVRGGFTYREAHLMAEVLCEFLAAPDCPYALAGLDVVEVNPLVDRNNETAKMAVEWIGSLFGKTILGAK